MGMQIGTPVLSPGSVWLNAIRNNRRKSLQLPWSQRGQSNLQVLSSPKLPKAWVPGHLLEAQGMEITTSMAPLKVCCLGWRDTHQILPTNYGSHFESEPCSISQGTDYVGVSEAAG